MPEVTGAGAGLAASQGRARRIDARRNLESILEAARIVLPVRPDASMGEIAAAAGVHRATVHRHFAAREDLITSLRLRAVEETVNAVVAAASVNASRAGRAADGVEAVCDAILEIAARYQLFRFTTWRDAETEQRGAEVDHIVMELLDRGAREGDIRTDLSASELRLLWSGLMETLGPATALGQISRDDAARLLRRVLAADPARVSSPAAGS